MHSNNLVNTALKKQHYTQYINNKLFNNYCTNENFIIYVTDCVSNILCTDEQRILSNILSNSDLNQVAIANNYSMNEMLCIFNESIDKITNFIMFEFTNLINDFNSIGKKNIVKYENDYIYNFMQNLMKDIVQVKNYYL